MATRTWLWPAVMALASLVLLSEVPRGASALRCYKCNNCIKYELSQSQHCAQGETHCVKMDMETGTVQRNCGTEDICNNDGKNTKTKTHYVGISCCTDDNCNASSSLIPATFLLFLLPAAMVTRHYLLGSC